MSNLSKENINLVTGGGGFIGSNLIKYLLKMDEKVVCIDNFSSSSKDNINLFLGNPNFKLIEKDITKLIDIKANLIWHLACPASPAKYILDPIQTLKTSFTGTLNMLELAKKNSAKFLLASSSEIYSKSKIHPQVENYMISDSPYNARSCYVEGKRISETLCYQYKDLVDIRIARIFNTYGPMMLIDDGRSISNFIKQALNKEPLTIYGEGYQTRSFCFIDDLIYGIVELMNSKYKLPLNIGSNNEISILELGKTIQKKLNLKESFNFKNSIEDEPNRRCPDLNVTFKTLSWRPKVELSEGLDRTIQDFQERYFN